MTYTEPALRREPLTAVEAAIALLTALTLPAIGTLFLSSNIAHIGQRFQPTEQYHQITVVSMLTLAFLTLGAVLIFLSARPRRRGRHSYTVGTAGIAGAATGIWAAGVIAALYGTPWSFNANQGDAGRYIEWATDLTLVPTAYPPGGIWLLRATATTLGIPEAVALKPLTILVVSLTGPLAYLAWRLVSGPIFSLFAGVVVAVPHWDFYLPTRRIVLFLAIPIMIAIVQLLLAEGPAAQNERPPYLRAGALSLGLGILVVTYSAWIYFMAIAVAPIIILLVLKMMAEDKKRRWHRFRLSVASVVPFLLATSPYVLPVALSPDSRPTALVDLYGPSIERALGAAPSAFWGETGFAPMLIATAILLAVVLSKSPRSQMDMVLSAALASAVAFRLLLLFRFGITGNPGLVQRTDPVIGYLILVISLRGLQILLRRLVESAGDKSRPLPLAGDLKLIGLITAAVLLVVNVPLTVQRLMPAESGEGRLAQVAHETEAP